MFLEKRDPPVARHEAIVFVQRGNNFFTDIQELRLQADEHARQSCLPWCLIDQPPAPVLQALGCGEDHRILDAFAAGTSRLYVIFQHVEMPVFRILFISKVFKQVSLHISKGNLRRFVGHPIQILGDVVVMLHAIDRGFFFHNEPPPTELVVARWKYTAWGKFGGTGWAHNYPSSDQHFAQVVSEATNIDVTNVSYRIVELGSPEVFNYPFAVVSEPGELALTEAEVRNLREYVDRGGFVVMDDFDGSRDLGTLKRDLHRAFPDRELVRLTIDHEIFHTFFDIDALNVTSPYLVDGDPIFYALLNKDGNVGIIACYNNDLENFWDYIDRGEYPLKPSIEAFRLGIDFVIYSMTH